MKPSKLISMESDCACGAKVLFSYKKPKPFGRSIIKAVCSECGSRYLIAATLTGFKFLGADVSDIAKDIMLERAAE